ncbi:hypothetical protein WG904_04760 [Pedobacter sp. Du54]|uniref:hypothetical protein n=1 Tax=Pedobacter anseongensis TaxID=3133439 RepID=UPI0030A9C179
MKNNLKLLILLTGTILPSILKAQKTQKINNGVEITFKGVIEQVGQTAAEEYAKKNKIEYLSAYEGLKNRNIYTVDGIIFTSVKMNTAEKRGLEKLKKAIDERALSVNLKTYSSRIITNHGYKILVTENTAENRLNFTAIDSSGYSSVLGVLDFNPTKRSEAKLLLDDIIKSINFE